MMFRLTALEKLYGGRPVLSIPKLEIAEGEVVGLVGGNGSGKSTLLRLLALLENPSRGRLESAAGRADVSLLLQKPVLLKRSVYRNVAYGLEIRGRGAGIADRVVKVLEEVGLAPEVFSRRRWFELSGGEAQRVALASRLVFAPRVLLLDEPTANVDAASAGLIREVILKLKKAGRTTLVIASHDEVWLNSLSDRVLRLQAGRLLGSGAVNLLPGPWQPGKDGLWRSCLADGREIIAGEKTAAQALLAPEDVLIAAQPASGLSARNQLSGQILSLAVAGELIRLRIQVAELSLQTTLTPAAVQELALQPGRRVYVIFKASAVFWG